MRFPSFQTISALTYPCQGDIVPDPTEPERQAIGLHLAPAVNALIAEALARSGATREDIRQEKLRRRGTR